MRDILFRGKDAVTGEWRYGDLLRFGIDRVPHIKPFCKVDGNAAESFLVAPETVGQLTLEFEGVVKFFENDIVELWGEEPFEYCSCTTGYDWKMRGVVKMLNGAWSVVEIGDTWGPSFTEIICEDVDIDLLGNIFDNPEILGEK